jgi:BlaI family penicillinase repressor
MARPRMPHPTPSELEVLQILWERGSGNVRDVLETLNQRRPRAYTTVMTLLNVMVEKGLLRREADGRAFVYTPRVQRQPALRKMVGDLVKRAFGGSARQLVAHALEQTDPSPQELDEIQKLIDSYRAQQEGKR